MFGLSTTEILIVLVVLLLLFGSRLPSVMRSLGKSVTEFKKGMNEITEEPRSVPRPVERPESKDENTSEAPPAG